MDPEVLRARWAARMKRYEKPIGTLVVGPMPWDEAMKIHYGDAFYAACADQQKMAAMLGVDLVTLRRVLTYHGVHVGPGSSRRSYWRKHQFPPLDSPEWRLNARRKTLTVTAIRATATDRAAAAILGVLPTIFEEWCEEFALSVLVRQSLRKESQCSTVS